MTDKQQLSVNEIKRIADVTEKLLPSEKNMTLISD